MIDAKHLAMFAKFAGRLADASGAVIRAAATKPFDLEIKGDGSPVTEVDKAVEDRIRALIGDEYPTHGILGEERDDVAPDAELKWIIDPIDGTLPFLAGFPVFGTLIALVHGEKPVLGVIDLPMTNDRWIGCTGEPTTRNGVPVHTRKCDTLSNALMSTSNPDFFNDADQPALQRMRDAVRWGIYGGSCTAYAQIASGRIDVGFDVEFDIYDYLALVPVILGAGGLITDWNGKDLTTNSGDRLVAAGDKRVHQQALNILGS